MRRMTLLAIVLTLMAATLRGCYVVPAPPP